jgi:hypothetical protein
MREVRRKENFTNHIERQNRKTAASLSMPRLPNPIQCEDGNDLPGFTFTSDIMVQGDRVGLRREEKSKREPDPA